MNTVQKPGNRAKPGRMPCGNAPTCSSRVGTYEKIRDSCIETTGIAKLASGFLSAIYVLVLARLVDCGGYAIRADGRLPGEHDRGSPASRGSGQLQAQSRHQGLGG